ncbi:hypothetical protein LUZ60_008240 [Juncus effusus]|nr:hypothetical protein LUZ60_008240 [Juncus effusus]
MNLFSINHPLTSKDMACTHFSMVLILLLSGMFASEQLGADAKCPSYCADISFMTCPETGDQQLPARCNCCVTVGSKGCTLHYHDGATPTKCC